MIGGANYPSEMFDHPSDTYVGDDIPKVQVLEVQEKLGMIYLGMKVFINQIIQKVGNPNTSESPTIFNWNGTDCLS